MKKSKIIWVKNLTLVCLIILGIMSNINAGTVTENKTYVYLTFDDGPSEYTEKLLDILHKYNMKATFFMLRDEMLRYPQMVNRMIQEGHAVGIHGVTHEKCQFYKNVDSPLNEMNDANKALFEVSSCNTKLIRTPYGSIPYLTKEQEAKLTNEGYVIWDWNIDSRDWCYRNPGKTFNQVIKSLKACNRDTKVILLHDIKFVNETMELIGKWMKENAYESKPITIDLQAVRLINYKKK